MKNKEQPNYYAIIPANVRYDKDLNPNAKLLYGEITALTSSKGYCWASNDYFAKLYNVSKQSITNWLNILKEKKYIETQIIYKEGTQEILGRYIKLFGEGTQEILGRGTQEILGDNNTYTNNTLNNILNDFKIYSNFDTNEFCDCIAKSTNEKCNRKSCWNINGKNYCNQHSKKILEKIFESTNETKKTSFKKPTIEELKAYCEENNFSINCEYFYDYYEGIGWVIGKNKPMKDWQATVRNWDRRNNTKSKSVFDEIREECEREEREAQLRNESKTSQ